ncbi:MAG: GDSL-type esterase/lipase family protein [Alphaproteobacteria bacterium]|nr:GDSL-type esterase/lipase family protein [Alphaproteobacteria bacterium]MDP6589610.1 GDSL-type esterase/lipase family protein [Alphaproteobacteria bacterium]
MALRICFIGDSITNGYGDPQYGGWPAVLSASARRDGTDITAYNLGVRGDTSSMIRKRWRDEATARLPAEMPGALVFAFGINDCARIDGVRRVEPAQSVENAGAILAAATAWLPTIFVGPTPVDAARGTPQILPGKKLEIDNDLIADMNARLAALCGEMAVGYVDVMTALGHSADWRATMAAGDGVHPTAEGYAIIACSIGANLSVAPAAGGDGEPVEGESDFLGEFWGDFGISPAAGAVEEDEDEEEDELFGEEEEGDGEEGGEEEDELFGDEEEGDDELFGDDDALDGEEENQAFNDE